MEKWLRKIQYFVDASYCGIPVSNFAIPMLILLAAVLFRKIFTRVILGFLAPFTQKTKYHLDRLLLDALGRPLGYVFILLGLFIGSLVLTKPIDTSENEARLSMVKKELQKDFEKKPKRKDPRYDLWKSLTAGQKKKALEIETLNRKVEENEKTVHAKEDRLSESFPVVPEKDTPEYTAYEKLFSELASIKEEGVAMAAEIRATSAQKDEIENRLKEFQEIPARGDPRFEEYQALLKTEDSLATQLLMARTANGWLVKTKKIMAAVMKAFSAFILFWILYNLVSVLAFYLGEMTQKTGSGIDDPLVSMTRKCLRIFVAVIGGVVVIQNLGYSLTSVIAGLGLGGLAFALAAKDTIGNFFGSIAVLVDRPFRVGEWVVVNGKEGTVEEVGFRSTRIRTFYDSLIVIPNAEIANATIDNMGKRRYRRKYLKLVLKYDTPPNKIEAFCEGVRELIRLLPHTRKDYYHVFLSDFRESSIEIMLYFFVEAPDWTTELREWHRSFICIKKLAARLRVEFAFPTQTLDIPGLPQSPGPPGPPTSNGNSTCLIDDPETIAKAYELGRKMAREIAGELAGDNIHTLPPPARVHQPETLLTTAYGCHD